MAPQVVFISELKKVRDPWHSDIETALGKRFDYSVYDSSRPAAEQFAGVRAVVDLGGGASRELLKDVAEAGVEFVQTQTNGLDHIDIDFISSLGLRLAHCPGELSSVALAQNAMMFILMLAGRYRQGMDVFDAGDVYFPTGIELVGMKLGIVGFGASGVELARRAKPFGLEIMAVDVRPIDQDILDDVQPQFLGTPDDMDKLASESDFLSLHLHLNSDTRHTMDARHIGLMKPSAFAVNVCRGALWDEEALYEALMEGRIAGAGLDVFSTEPPDHTLPVFHLPTVVVTPHIAGSTDGTSRKRAEFAADNVDRFLKGEEPRALVC